MKKSIDGLKASGQRFDILKSMVKDTPLIMLTSWEAKFIESMMLKQRYSAKEVAKITELYERYCQ